MKKRLLQLKRRMCSIITLSLVAFPALALQPVKLRGNDVSVNNNDIMATFIEIGAAVVGVVLGAICVYSLIQLLISLWKKWGEMRVGQAETQDLVHVVIVGGGMFVLTAALSYYIITNFTSFF
ncbi:hypothetical protein AB9X29_003730 [Vibrio vulnificus]